MEEHNNANHRDGEDEHSGRENLPRGRRTMNEMTNRVRVQAKMYSEPQGPKAQEIPRLQEQ